MAKSKNKRHMGVSIDNRIFSIIDEEHRETRVPKSIIVNDILAEYYSEEIEKSLKDSIK